MTNLKFYYNGIKGSDKKLQKGQIMTIEEIMDYSELTEIFFPVAETKKLLTDDEILAALAE